MWRCGSLSSRVPFLSTSVPSRSAALYSTWGSVKKGPEDPILGVTISFNKDTDPRKINLGVGAYRDDNGQPYILESVKEASNRIVQDPKENHEYLPIGGDPAFTQAAIKLSLGENAAVIKEKRVVTCQALSGTGSLRVAADFINRFYTQSKKIYLPTPTWPNHIPLFTDAGLDVQHYRYYDKNANGIDFQGLTDDLRAAPEGSIVLFHACAHNPTGQDPTIEQWRALSSLTKSRNHFVVFDSAYQGFASGDTEKDARSIRQFLADGHEFALCQSFAKNFGLYGERAGAVSFLTSTTEEALAVESQLKILIRPMYSNPPKYGAKVVATILNDPQLNNQWKKEVKGMADRIITMRTRLVESLKREGSQRNWSHITDQIGMFCYSGLTPEQVDTMANTHHIYMTRNGRISMVGVTSKNVDYLASAMHQVTK